MALDNFKPQIWITRILANLHAAQVYTQRGVVNRDYQGDIARAGDTVHINAIGEISVRNYAGAVTYDELTEDQLDLFIDQKKYFGFEIDDVDAAQANVTVMNDATRESAVALRKVADTFIGGLYTEATTTVGSDEDPAVITGDAAYDRLVDLGVALDETETPDAGRFAVIPAWYHGVIRKDERFVASGAPAADARLRNGVVGEAAGFTLLKSNNTPAAGGTDVAIQTSAAADDIIDATAHGFAAGDAVQFTALTGGTGLTTNTRYYVLAASLTADDFKVSETPGGAAVDFTTDITAGSVEAIVNNKVIAGHPMAWSYAEQIVSMEGFRSQESFADRMRGLHVYGGKVVRPAQLAVLSAARR